MTTTTQNNGVATALPLPGWAESIRRKYLGGESSLFVLHHNVYDNVLYDGRYYPLVDFLAKVLLWGSKDNIIVYDPSAGVSFVKRADHVPALDHQTLGRDPKKVLPFLEEILHSASSAAVVLTYASMIVPAAEVHFLGEQDRINLVTLHRWSLSERLAARDNVVLLQAETLSELNGKLLANPSVSAIEVPLPDVQSRAAVIRKSDPSIDDVHVQLLAEHAAGLKAVQLASMLTPRDGGLDDQQRLAFIRSLLHASKDADQRAGKLAAITQGMDRHEIRHLIAPDQQLVAEPQHDPYAEVITLLQRRKRELIEKECSGLIEFVAPKHDLTAVGGNEGVKHELRRVAANIRRGERARVPMGLLFVGPMGSGKTFVANAFVRESGLSAVRLKNFRSKWVGATEANLEKVLQMVKSLGPLIVIIDEGDRAFGGSAADEDGGTSSRVIARLKEFMSDTEQRGKVLFILLTNRPDRLDVDIKRAGRIDRKIPFFYPSDVETVESILTAVARRHQVELHFDWRQDRAQTSQKLLGYSSADLEAVVLLAFDAARADDAAVDAERFSAAIADYLPPRDEAMLEYMELLAVFETSRRSLLPPSYAQVTAEELNRRLRDKRRELRI